MYSLGRLKEHDPRSLAYPAKTAATLRSVSHSNRTHVLDQGETSACTGNAIAQALNSAPLRHGRKALDEDDALKLYSRATVLDGFPGTYPPDDDGSSGLAAAKAAKEAGYISGYTHAFGLDQALAALVISPVIIGIGWHEASFEPDSRGYLSIDGPVAGGHEVALIGLNVRSKIVTVLNSWGPGWGNNGRAYLRWADLGTLLADDGDVTVPVL